MPNVKNIELAKIRIDGGTQARAHIDEDAVADYAERLIELPDAEVVFDGSDYWLWDGFHRYHAHARAKRKSMRCRVRKGTRRDAVLAAIGANAEHGLRRSNADKRRALDLLFADPVWAKLSARQQAKMAGVTHTFTNNYRHEKLDVCREVESGRFVKDPDGVETVSTPDEANCEPAKKAANQKGRPAKVDKEEPAVEETPTAEPVAPAEPPESPPTKPAAEDEPPLDAAGAAIPKELRPAFAQAPAFRSLMKRLSDLKAEYLKLCDLPGGEWGNRRRQIAAAHFENVHSEIRFSIPYGICPSCGGAKCDDCKQIGFLHEEAYKAAPDALKPLPRQKGRAA